VIADGYHAPASHPFSLRQLQYAIAVADEPSFRRAAAKCRVSQPSLSAQLAQLEGVLGVRLFERDRRRVLVTAAGKDIVERARRLLADADALLDAGKRASDPFVGTLRVGVIPTTPVRAAEHRAASAEAIPWLTMAWREDKTDVPAAALQAGELTPRRWPWRRRSATSIAKSSPTTSPCSPCGTAIRWHARRRRSDVGAAGPGAAPRRRALLPRPGARRLHDGRARGASSAPSLTTLVQMVAGGSGVTLLPQLVVPTERRERGSPAPDRAVAAHRNDRARGASDPRSGPRCEIGSVMRDAYPHDRRRAG
jgi:LysR family hydrogen peroxide-inducible transcriptional activator